MALYSIGVNGSCIKQTVELPQTTASEQIIFFEDNTPYRKK